LDKKTFIINSQFFGHGDNELGEQLMGSFLRKLWSLDKRPDRIIFYNTGVKLLAEGSPALDALDGLAKEGVDLIACGTCATHFDLKQKIVVGRVGDMNEIATSMMSSSSVVTV